MRHIALALVLLLVAPIFAIGTGTPSLIQEINTSPDTQSQQASTPSQSQPTPTPTPASASASASTPTPQQPSETIEIDKRAAAVEYFFKKLPASESSTTAITDCIWTALQQAGENNSHDIDVTRIQGHRSKTPWLYFQNVETKKAYVARVFSVQQHHERLDSMIRATSALFQMQLEIPSVHFALPMYGVSCGAIDDLPNRFVPVIVYNRLID
jgi:hypothetical protein